MFLAGKVEETHRPIREVIVFSYHIRFRIDPLAKERIEQKVIVLLVHYLYSDVYWMNDQRIAWINLLFRIY